MSLRIIPKDQRTPVRRTSAARGKRYSNTSVSKRKSIKTWRGTVLPGLIMFLCTLGLIFLSIFLLFLLISQGMFKRQVVTVNAQLADTYFWTPYGQSCVLTSAGFTPNSYDCSALSPPTSSSSCFCSCDADTTSIIPDKPFTVVGSELAKQWAAELTQDVIRSMISPNEEGIGRSYDYFPDCLPTEPQDVAGMAMLETTIRDTHVDGLYFLTLYADLDPSMTVYSYVNSDGTTQNLIDNIKRTLITVDGQVETDKLGRDYIITSRPLDEVIVLQAMSSFLSLWFFAGDMFITIEGLGGLLSGAPVLKYTVLSGLERRKVPTYQHPPLTALCFLQWLLVCIVVNSMPGLLYMDVSRIYYYSTNGFKVYVLSSIMVANFFTFGFFIALRWLVSTVWCRSNSVLSALHLPNCITALPLDPSNGIKMGNKIKWGKDKRDANQLPSQLISIYALLPVMVVPSWVSSFGTVDHNHFTPTPATRLAQAKRFMHTRGSCVV
ncbi:hypothetical protein DYB30_007610 [Aphanomyces astaci]|uniref:Uncharacterized protein n=1 Tax=Aphanomyces astaci TaxID=112090 RepID=A0A397CC16_APHAT|nr:hypothetical protein DYB30_007610 [Aphanomyces astaci]